MPNGLISYGEKWVESARIAFSGAKSDCVLRGRFDMAIEMDGGGYGVVDLKTADRNEEHIPLYSRQLHAYAYALENAAPGRLALKPVRRLGLLVFSPERFLAERPSVAELRGSLEWIEVTRDDATFLKFLEEVVSVLGQTTPPAPGACDWCRHRGISMVPGV
jgi:PD-(D/E)XK nuclease superfamily